MSRKERKSEISRKWLGGSPIFAFKKNKGKRFSKTLREVFHSSAPLMDDS